MATTTEVVLVNEAEDDTVSLLEVYNLTRAHLEKTGLALQANPDDPRLAARCSRLLSAVNELRAALAA